MRATLYNNDQSSPIPCLELAEGLGTLDLLLLDLEDVEANGLRDGPLGLQECSVSMREYEGKVHNNEQTERRLNKYTPALTNGDNIPRLNTDESRAQVGSQVLVPLLVPVVLLDEVQVFPPNDDGALHFGGDDDTGEDTATDVNGRGGEGALFVDVVTFDGFAGGFEAETDVLVPALCGHLFAGADFGVGEEAKLLLEGFFGLVGGNGVSCDSEQVGSTGFGSVQDVLDELPR